MTKLGSAVGELKLQDGIWHGSVDIWCDGSYKRHKVESANRTKAIRELARLRESRQSGHPSTLRIKGLPMDYPTRTIPIICPGCGRPEAMSRNGVGSWHSGTWSAVCGYYNQRIAHRWMIRKQRDRWFAIPIDHSEGGEFSAGSWREAYNFAFNAARNAKRARKA